jgi:Sec-independent protein secretion pathway component TatC
MTDMKLNFFNQTSEVRSQPEQKARVEGSSEEKKVKNLHQYHSLELKARILYLLLSLVLSFIICFKESDFLLYKLTSIFFTKPSNSLWESSSALQSKEEVGFAFPVRSSVEGFISNEGLVGVQSHPRSGALATLPSSTSSVERDSLAPLKVCSTEQAQLGGDQRTSPSEVLALSLGENLGYADPLGGSGFIFTELLEGFWSTLLLAGYGALGLSLPVIYYHIYKFVLPGLKYMEARFLKVFLLLSLSFFIFIHLLTYYLIIPYAASFFLSFQSNYPQSGFLHFTGRIYPALTFILNFFTIFSLLFQLPLVCFYLFAINAMRDNQTTNSVLADPLKLPLRGSSEWGSQTFLRKLLFFSLVLLTAIFSPPDLYSQLFLFVPLFFILEIFIFMVFVFKHSPYSKKSSSAPN